MLVISNDDRNILIKKRKDIYKMSKKVAVASIMCLVLGGVALPGGILLDNLITDLTYSSVDEGLLGIKEEGVPLVEPMIKQYGSGEALSQIKNVGTLAIEDLIHQMGPAIALSTIEDIAPDAIEEMILQMGPAIALDLIREQALEASGPLVNATIWMNLIYEIEQMLGQTGLPGIGDDVAEDIYWDEVGIWVIILYVQFHSEITKKDYPEIYGISEWYGEDLNFGINRLSAPDPTEDYGVNRLKYGVDVEGWWGNRLPGVFEDTLVRTENPNWPEGADVDTNQDRGFGILELMSLIENASDTLLNEMADGYGLETSDGDYYVDGNHKLRILYNYYNDYFVSDVIDLFINDFNTEGTALWTDMPQYRPRDWNEGEISYDELKLYSFYEQWAKCLSYDDGVDFSVYEDSIPTNTRGLEPGGPDTDSGIPMEATFRLWDESSEYSFLNIENGIQKWYNAYFAHDSFNQSIYNELLNFFTEFDGYDYEQSLYGSSGFDSTDMDLILDWLWGNGGGWNQGAFYTTTLPTLLTSWYDVTMDSFCKQILFEQWANGTVLGMDLYPQGIDFSTIIDGMDPDTTGLEPGVVIPLNLTYDQCEELWNQESNYSLTNMDGILLWYEANSSDAPKEDLIGEFPFLNNDTIDLILEWLWAPNGFSYGLFPLLTQAPEPYGYSSTVSELALKVLYEQWSNGTALGMDLYPNGIDFSTMVDGIVAGTTGLEAGIPVPLNLTFEQCDALWNPENNLSLLNMFEGIPKWVEANEYNETKQLIMNEFNLTSAQIDLILQWLWGEGCFSDYLVPILIESEMGYGVPMEDFCFQILLEQWANGSVMGEEMYPNGFPLPLGDKEIYGFEVGIPEPTNMCLGSALALWNTSSPNSLVSKEGLERWFAAIDGDMNAYDEVKSANGLDDHCMECILKWIPEFQQNVMPSLAEYQYGLPMDSISLANTIQIGGVAIGGVAIGLGSTGLSRNYLVKRKKKKLILPKSKKEMGKSIQNLNNKLGNNLQKPKSQKLNEPKE
ncbi:MAG: hypothetical protein BAJALOKI3v1_470015 [Promethearchaeota archaeon]|nr:MAG: hypothetical protein BAJALOKI3v1_470015 [Candidatus Lokiarchaeota archaeon]